MLDLIEREEGFTRAPEERNPRLRAAFGEVRGGRISPPDLGQREPCFTVILGAKSRRIILLITSSSFRILDSLSFSEI